MKYVLNFLLVFVVGFSFTNTEAFAASGEAIKSLPVQNGGRIKPYDSYARETLELLYGRSEYKRPSDGKKEPASYIVMSFLLSPDSWAKIPLFEINNLEIKKLLKLNAENKHFAPEDIFNNENLSQLMQQLTDKRENKEKLDPYFQAVQRLENQIYTFNEIVTGKHLHLVPKPVEANSDQWLSLAEMPEPNRKQFIEISTNFAKFLGQKEKGEGVEQAGLNFDESVNKFRANLKTEFGDRYEDTSRINSEVFYNTIHFFRLTYIMYLLAAVILLYSWIQNVGKLNKVVWSLALIGFILHSVGFGYRVYLAGRPPVTNMYETVVWVSWGVILFSMILEKIYKYKSILFAGLVVGVFSMVVADMAPAVLDPSLQPLEAVLRSSYWLIIHVMTITISYSAFFLAFGLGDIGLLYYLLDEKKYQEQIRNISTAIYRAMQIGVAFLTPGIILGGIWADYSWGRFWGWDPKETWALIVLLGYIIILHMKLIKWIENFGMIISAILAFNLVIMAWYGVNFILGAGLHSYGFGAGGVEYVSVFVALHLLVVLFVFFARRAKTLSPKN